jgi:hypothetical protein
MKSGKTPYLGAIANAWLSQNEQNVQWFFSGFFRLKEKTTSQDERWSGFFRPWAVRPHSADVHAHRFLKQPYADYA